LKYLLNSIDEKFTEEDVEYMIKVADKDSTGSISYKEYLRVLMNEIDE